MGRQAWISILGLYEYDPSIFNGMVLPDGVDRSVLINNILVECAELEILLPEPDVLKRAISFWSRSQLQVWTKLYESTQYDYNPIWNKDGIIKETETRDLSGTSGGTDTDQTSAFNSSVFQNADKTIMDRNYADGGTITREREEHGNIGVTTTQQMIKEQREVVQFNIYDYILRAFKERFCIMVY